MKENEDHVLVGWLSELEQLVHKYAYLNIVADLQQMTMEECWGVYQWLCSKEDQ